MNNYKEMPNGDLIFPIRMIPNKIENYTQDIGNPTVFHLNYCECVHRSTNLIRLPCGKLKAIPICKKNELIELNPKICHECKYEKTQ